MNRVDEILHPHRQAWDLIPWLVNGRLPAEELKAVEAHLRSCETCRRELEMQQQLKDIIRHPDSIEYAPGPSLQKLRWRMDEIAAALPGKVPESPADVGQRPRPRRRVLPDWAGALLAAQAAVIAVLAVVVLVQIVERRLPVYRTVTTAPATAADLRVVFAPGTTVRQIQGLLAASGTAIVAGPSPSGVYSLALAEGQQADAAPRAAKILGAHPEVLFVTAERP